MLNVAPALRKRHSFGERIFGALLLRSEIYDEVKKTPRQPLREWFSFFWPSCALSGQGSTIHIG
jgi:hypothetical protein